MKLFSLDRENLIYPFIIFNIPLYVRITSKSKDKKARKKRKTTFYSYIHGLRIMLNRIVSDCRHEDDGVAVVYECIYSLVEGEC